MPSAVAPEGADATGLGGAAVDGNASAVGLLLFIIDCSGKIQHALLLLLLLLLLHSDVSPGVEVVDDPAYLGKDVGVAGHLLDDLVNVHVVVVAQDCPHGQLVNGHFVDLFYCLPPITIFIHIFDWSVCTWPSKTPSSGSGCRGCCCGSMMPMQMLLLLLQLLLLFLLLLFTWRSQYF